MGFGGKDLRTLINRHFGKDPAGMPVVTEEFERYNHPNLHLALETVLQSNGRKVEKIGIQGGFLAFNGTSLSEMVTSKSFASKVGLGGAKQGPLQHTNIQLDGNNKLACITSGLFLVKGAPPVALLLRNQASFTGANTLVLDVMAEESKVAEGIIAELRQQMAAHNVYRGKILSLEKAEAMPGNGGIAGIKFHHVPSISREQIILPEGLLQKIERQTIEVGKYSEALLAARRKLKRGILLHGKPGTGKTMTAMYLSSAMKERTVLIVTGRGMGLIESSCQIARWLQPAIVIIEDVDLIAEERSVQGQCNTSHLFELLNQMDGLADDADVLFLLTTNRPEILEPALAARPGRIDQAYEVPLPDAECRRRLFDLYGQGLQMEVENMEMFIKRTAGASGAFISELLRKAALFAAPDGVPIVVKDRHMDEALNEMVVVGGRLTTNLLGFSQIGFAAAESAID